MYDLAHHIQQTRYELYRRREGYRAERLEEQDECERARVGGLAVETGALCRAGCVGAAGAGLDADEERDDGADIFEH